MFLVKIYEIIRGSFEVLWFWFKKQMLENTKSFIQYECLDKTCISFNISMYWSDQYKQTSYILNVFFPNYASVHGHNDPPSLLVPLLIFWEEVNAQVLLRVKLMGCLVWEIILYCPSSKKNLWLLGTIWIFLSFMEK